MTDTLTFYVATTSDGQYLAVSEHEPLFCFCTDTEEEAVRTAQVTFEDYQRRFKRHNASLRAEPVNPLPIRHVSGRKTYALEEVA